MRRNQGDISAALIVLESRLDEGTFLPIVAAVACLQVAINVLIIVSLPGDLVSQVSQQYKHVRDGADEGAVDRVSSPGRENVSVLGSQVRLHTRSR